MGTASRRQRMWANLPEHHKYRHLKKAGTVTCLQMATLCHANDQGIGHTLLVSICTKTQHTGHHTQVFRAQQHCATECHGQTCLAVICYASQEMPIGMLPCVRETHRYMWQKKPVGISTWAQSTTEPEKDPQATRTNQEGSKPMAPTCMEHATPLYNDVGAIHTAHSAEGLGKQQMVAQVLVPQAAPCGRPTAASGSWLGPDQSQPLQPSTE